MDKKEIYELMSGNPVFQLATVQGDRPRVRSMLLYRADENGIVFHTGRMKPMYEQVKSNPKAELCFVDAQTGKQVRVSGVLDIVDDNTLKDEIYSHPSRTFLAGFRESRTEEAFYRDFIVFRLKNGVAAIWTMEKNFDPPEETRLD